MRGRSPYNKPEIRIKELLYYMLDKEKVRWKTIKDDFRKERWGPTTLKKFLDLLVKHGLVDVDVTHGPRGPEVWYCVKIFKLAEDLFKMQKKLVLMNVERFSLKELESTSPRLRTVVYKVMLNLFMAQFINYSFITALTKFRNAEVKNIDYILRTASEHFWDVGFKEQFKKLVDFILVYPVDVQNAVAKMIGVAELKAWIEGREFAVKEFKKLVEVYEEFIPELLKDLKTLYENAKSKDEMLVFKKAIQSFENILKELDKR